MPPIDLSQYKPGMPRKEESKSLSLLEILNRDIFLGSGQVSDMRKESFYHELSTLLESGIDLRNALDLILVDQHRPKDKGLFEDIKKGVLKGNSLSGALGDTRKFSDYEYFSIGIGEETGKLSEVLAELAAYYKSRIQQRRKIISAVTYPIIVLVTSMGAVFFMIQFVVPMFADIFTRFGGELPWITGFILRISSFFKNYFAYFFLVFSLGCLFLFLNRKEPWYRRASSSLVLRLPIAGDIVRKIYLARLTNTMRLLVSSDIPLLRAILLVRQMINFYPIETSLQDVEQDIMKGRALHESLSKFSFYPPKLIQLIKVGEEVNRLDHFFEKVSLQYTEEVEYRTNTISSLLEPLIIIFLGLVVGAILIAMYLPMFQMSNGF